MDIKVSEDAGQQPVEVFCCCAREDTPLLSELKLHLNPLVREGLIALWSDVDIGAGMEWEKEIHRRLDTAPILLLLVSPDFLASEYCYGVEVARAMERHEQGAAYVIPVILRPCIWDKAPFSKLRVLPTDTKPIVGSGSRTQDEAFADVARGLRNAIATLASKRLVDSAHRRDTLSSSPQNILPATGLPSKRFHFPVRVVFLLLVLVLSIYGAMLLWQHHSSGKQYCLDAGATNVVCIEPGTPILLTATAQARATALAHTPGPMITPQATATSGGENGVPSGWPRVSSVSNFLNWSQLGCHVSPDGKTLEEKASDLNGCIYQRTPDAIDPGKDTVNGVDVWDNVAVSVDVLEITQDQCAGIAIRLEENTYYYFCLNASRGTYMFVRYDPVSQTKNAIVSPTRSQAIHTGQGEENTLLIVAQGSSFKLLINGDVVKTNVTDPISSPLVSGRIALVVDGSNDEDALFSHVQVWSPDTIT